MLLNYPPSNAFAGGGGAYFGHPVNNGAADFQYGTYDDPGAATDALSKAKSYGFYRRRLNVVAIILGYMVPWTLFCLVFAIMSFWWRYKYSIGAWGLTIGILLMVMALGASSMSAVMRRKRGQTLEDPHWKVFLFVTCLLAWGLAVNLGSLNFSYYMQPFFDLEGLKAKSGVDPAVNFGAEMMDAGRVEFVGTTRVDTSKAHGFKNGDMYCVAPITNGGPLANYDFWAVGVNCCNGEPGDFAGCMSGANESQAVRFMYSEPRPFLRLAIQQAEAKYQIKATHPLFFLWASDSTAAMKAYENSGYKMYIMGMLGYFLLQCVLVAGATSFFQSAW